MDFFWKIWKIRNATLIWRADLATMMSPKCTMRKGIKKETRSPKERAQDTRLMLKRKKFEKKRRKRKEAKEKRREKALLPF